MIRPSFLPAVFLLLAWAMAATAQENFYRVYQYETPLAGWAEPTIWNTYIAKSSNAYGHGLDVSRQGLWAHSAEFEMGATDHLSVSAYADFLDPLGAPPEFAQARVETRYHFADAYEHFFDTAIYAEYYFPRTSFSASQQLELRTILQKDLGDYRLVVNPVLTIPTAGSSAGQAPELGIDTGLYYRRRARVQPGFELYSSFGLIGTWKQQRYVVMPVADIYLSKGLVWEIGVGGGLSGPSDRLVVKSLLYYEFNAVVPTRWFRHGQ